MLHRSVAAALVALAVPAAALLSLSVAVAVACPPPPPCSPDETVCVDGYWSRAQVYRRSGDSIDLLWALEFPVRAPLISNRAALVERDSFPDNGSAAALTFFVDGAQTGALSLDELLTDINAATYDLDRGYDWLETIEWNADDHLVVTTVEGTTHVIDPAHPAVARPEPVEPAASDFELNDEWFVPECGTAELWAQEQRAPSRRDQVLRAAAIGFPLGAAFGFFLLARIRRRRKARAATRA